MKSSGQMSFLSLKMMVLIPLLKLRILQNVSEPFLSYNCRCFYINVCVDNYHFCTSVTKMMDLFRGIVAKGEYSERVLELTEELLELNAANYTIWYSAPTAAVRLCMSYLFILQAIST